MTLDINVCVRFIQDGVSHRVSWTEIPGRARLLQMPRAAMLFLEDIEV